MSSDDLAVKLKRFGLSEKKVDTFLTIVEHGEIKASTIADDAGVSKRYVYSICEDLEDRGLVVVNDHVSPTTIRARHPEEIADALKHDLNTIEEQLEERFVSATTNSRQYDVIKSRQTVLKRMRTYISKAEGELQLSVPKQSLTEIETELAAAIDRGVLIQLLIGNPGLDDSDVEDPPYEDICTMARRQDARTPLMVVSDQEYGLVGPPSVLSTAQNDAEATTLRDIQLVPMLVGTYLGNYWLAAEELYVAEPSPLPLKLSSFRRAVFEAQRHHSRGTPIVATVNGHPSDHDGGMITIRGELLSVRQSLIEPVTSRFPGEQSLTLDTEDGVTTVGGYGSFMEAFEADLVTLERVV